MRILLDCLSRLLLRRNSATDTVEPEKDRAGPGTPVQGDRFVMVAGDGLPERESVQSTVAQLAGDPGVFLVLAQQEGVDVVIEPWVGMIAIAVSGKSLTGVFESSAVDNEKVPAFQSIQLEVSNPQSLSECLEMMQQWFERSDFRRIRQAVEEIPIVTRIDINFGFFSDDSLSIKMEPLIMVDVVGSDHRTGIKRPTRIRSHNPLSLWDRILADLGVAIPRLPES